MAVEARTSAGDRPVEAHDALDRDQSNGVAVVGATTLPLIVPRPSESLSAVFPPPIAGDGSWSVRCWA